MTAYALGLMERPAGAVHSQVLDYLRAIDATLQPFGGRFLIHGAPLDVREGSWDGAVVLIEFADLESAQRWYDSSGYQAIRPWRADHLEGRIVLVDGVDIAHRAVDVIDDLNSL